MNQTIPRVQTASLSCSATGLPLPSIKWFKSQDSISNDFHFSVLPNGTLVINSASEQDSGWFTCRAMNNAGTVEKRAYLLVAGTVKIFGYKVTPKYPNQWARFSHPGFKQRK